MDHTAFQDIYKCFDAVWPYLVEKIGIAVDGDPEKIRELQRAPYNSLQMQRDSPSPSRHATGSFLPFTKTKRNRNPCHSCKARRQKCVRDPTDPATCERCSQKRLSCRSHDRDSEELEVIDLPAPSSPAFNIALGGINFGGAEGGMSMDARHTWISPQEAMNIAVTDTAFNLRAIPESSDNHVAPPAFTDAISGAGAVEGQYNQTWIFSSNSSFVSTEATAPPTLA